jgi:hypothetical protein
MTTAGGQRPTLMFDRSLLRGAGTLMGVGALVFSVGATLCGAAFIGAGRRYFRQLDERPIDMARRGWEQLRGSIAVTPMANRLEESDRALADLRK